CAVSKSVIPSSSARPIVAVASSVSNRPQSPPNDQVPKAIRDTWSSVWPRRTRSIVGSPSLADGRYTSSVSVLPPSPGSRSAARGPPRHRRPENEQRRSGPRNEFERGGSRLRGDDGVDDARGVSAVLGAVGGVDLVAYVVRLDEQDVLLDIARVDVCFVPVLGAAEPGRGASVDGSDVEVVAVADDPDRHGVPQCAVASDGREVQLIRPFDPA